MNGKTHPQKEIYKTVRQARTGSDRAEVIMRRSSAGFSVVQCDADEVAHFISLVVEHGDLCSFTLTSDGGALCIAVLSGAKQYKSYARSADELLIRFVDLLEVLY